MRVTYVADKTSLDEYKSKISYSKTSFSEGSYKYFTNGYINTCQDEIVIKMKNKINDYYLAIEKSYQAINSWMESYVQDMNRLDESLSNGTNTVVDSATNNYLNEFVNRINSEVTKSGDTIKQMNTNYDVSTYTETDYYPTEDGYELDIDEYIATLDEIEDEYNNQIEELEKQISDIRTNSLTYGTDPRYNKGESITKTQEDEIAELKLKITEIEYYKKEAQHIKDLQPYDEMMDTDEFYNFLIDYDGDALYEEYHSGDYYYDDVDLLAIIEYQKEHNTEEDFGVFQIDLGDTSISLSDFYNYTDDDQKLMYHYLFQTKGKEAANKYLLLLVDDINKAKGAAEAAEWIEDFEEYYASQKDGQNIGETILGFIASYSKVSIKGLNDGIETFGEGIYNSLVNNSYLTSDEYAASIIRTYLAENTGYGTVYDFHSSLGNMVPSIAASAITSILFTPAAGAVVGSSLMGISAGGNAKHQALVSGSSKEASLFYGFCIGVSETTLGYFLGKIPGIGKTSGLTLSNLLSEGVEEFAQEWVDAGLRAAILGEDIDLTGVTKDSMYSFFMGVAMAGYTNGASTLSKNLIITYEGKTYEISREDLIKEVATKLEANPNTNINEVIINKITTDGQAVSSNIGVTFASEQHLYDYDYFKYYDVGTNTFGVDQGYFRNLKYTNPTDYKRLQNKLVAQGYTKAQAKVILKNLDSTGACSYADICNGIFSTYKDNPTAFKQKFGFDMYIQNPDGTYQLNSGELLLDMYLYLNSTQNGGDLFYTDTNGKKYLLKKEEVYDANGNKTYRLIKTRKLYTENQQYLSGSYGIKTIAVDNYLNSKGGQNLIAMEIKSHSSYNTKLNWWDMEKMILDSEKYLKAGYKVHLGIGADPAKVNNIRLISLDGSEVVSTANWNEGGGHAVYVTGTCSEGFIVSSWGRSYVVPYEDLQSGNFTLEYYHIK